MSWIDRKEELDTTGGRLRRNGPPAVQKTGQAVTSSQQVKKGDAVHIRLAQGQLDATVDDIQE